MPDLSEAEIKAKIGDGTIFALSIDTAVFDKYGCHLDFAVLNKLDQFKRSVTALLFSEVVVNEIKNHIVRAAEDTQRELKKAIRQQGKRWKTEIDIGRLPPALALLADPANAAEAQLNDYLAAVGGEVVPASGSVDISGELLRRYFASESPFENNDKKKYEFPDAIALLSLEALAKEKKKLLLCVSPDKGWKNFAARSPYLVCIADLEAALSFFNDSGRGVTDQVMEMWRNGKAP
jgi:PIN domain